MGKTYKAVEITKPGTFRLVEKPVVGPGEEQVRIRVEACGVCHSDAGTVEGQLPGIVYPRVPGHEAIGRIEEVGRGVTTYGDAATPATTFGQFVGGVGTTTNAIPAFANIDPPRMFQVQARFIF